MAGVEAVLRAAARPTDDHLPSLFGILAGERHEERTGVSAPVGEPCGVAGGVALERCVIEALHAPAPGAPHVFDGQLEAFGHRHGVCRPQRSL